MSQILKQTKGLFTTLLVCLFILGLPATAKQQLSAIEAGPELGQKFPSINVLDQFSDRQQLANIVGPKGAIVVFFRSADWCPFCKRHLLELNAEAQKFKDKGYGVAAISYDSPEILRIFSQKNKLNYSLLSDQKVESFKALKVVNAQYVAGDRHYGIPYPGVIVIDKNGKVIHKYFYEGYKERVMFKQLLSQLE